MANERSSGTYTAVLKDENGNFPVLESLTFWLHDITDGGFTVVNSRDGVNVLSHADFSYSSITGLVTWLIRPPDMAILNSANNSETRRFTFSAKWNTGKAERNWEKKEEVVNMQAIT